MGMSSNNAKGFGKLYCEKCNEPRMFTLDLDDCSQFRCSDCDTMLDMVDVASLIDRLKVQAEQWKLAASWAATAPLCRTPDNF